MNFIDLFCGIGGFHQALKKLNAKCVWACDTDKNCREIYEMNYDIKPEKDIRNVDPITIPNFDILCAGFLVKVFPMLEKKCFKDKRGLLFDEIIRIASVKPKFMFLENVKHIKKIDNGKVFNYIINEIKRIGYFVDEEKTIFELSPHELGIPQQRKRIIFVCIRNDIYDVKNIINLNIGNNKIDFSKILETDKTIIDKYKIPKKIEKILDIWDEMVKSFDVDQKMSPTILCKEFYNEYSNEDFVNLAKWRQDYILKNKPIYEKYKNKWDKWYNKYEDFLKQREIYTKLEWQAGKKEK